MKTYKIIKYKNKKYFWRVYGHREGRTVEISNKDYTKKDFLNISFWNVLDISKVIPEIIENNFIHLNS